MNHHISLEITNELLVTQNFVNSCKIAAMKDDGAIDAEEQKVLKKISKAADKFMKELKKIDCK